MIRKQPPAPKGRDDTRKQSTIRPGEAPGVVRSYDPRPDDAPPPEDDDLNEALMQTFPASDPVSMESTLVIGRRKPRGRN
jgi:hypothetical protein